MGFAWPTMQKAIQDFVEQASGLPDTHVQWASQSSPRPTGQYISLRIMELTPVGIDWFQVSDAPEPVVEGQEIKLTTYGTREGRLSIQCFGGSSIGSQSPMARLESVRSAGSRRGALNALRDANVGLLRFGPVLSLDGLIGPTLEARASLDARLSLTSEVSEFATYIESIELTVTDSDGNPIGGRTIGPIDA